MQQSLTNTNDTLGSRQRFTCALWGAARGLLAVAGEGDAGRWAGGAFQVRSNSPIVFFPRGVETVPQKVGERGSEKTSGGANDQAILNAPETHLRKS